MTYDIEVTICGCKMLLEGDELQVRIACHRLAEMLNREMYGIPSEIPRMLSMIAQRKSDLKVYPPKQSWDAMLSVTKDMAHFPEVWVNGDMTYELVKEIRDKANAALESLKFQRTVPVTDGVGGPQIGTAVVHDDGTATIRLNNDPGLLGKPIKPTVSK